MTLCWLALGLAVLCWPASSLADHRLRLLIAADRLGATRQARGRTRCRLELSGRVVVGATAIAAAAGLVVGVPIAIALAGGVGAIGAIGLRAIRRRGDATREDALASVVQLLCAELEAGSSNVAALRAAAELPGPWQSGFAGAAQAAARGDDPVPILRAHVPARHGGIEALLGAWEVADRTGTALVAVLSRVDADLSDRRDQARRVASAVAGARSSAALLAGLPLLGIGLGASLGARPLSLLFGSVGGQALLGSGVLLDLLGVLWTVRIVDAAQR